MIVLDLEMSGLEPERSCIVSVGAVDFADATRVFYQECRIWDDAHVDPESLAVNGFTMEQINDATKPSVEETLIKFIDWLRQSQDQTIAGQNVSFDLEFLRAATKRLTLDWRASYRVVDLHSVCWAHMASRNITPPGKNGRTALSLDNILAYVGLPPEPKPHHGLTGAKMEAEAFSRLMHGKGLFDEFSSYDVAC